LGFPRGRRQHIRVKSYYNPDDIAAEAMWSEHPQDQTLPHTLDKFLHPIRITGTENGLKVVLELREVSNPYILVVGPAQCHVTTRVSDQRNNSEPGMPSTRESAGVIYRWPMYLYKTGGRETGKRIMCILFSWEINLWDTL
jgi:hypothetical protein